MKQTIRKPLISTSIFFIFLFFSFAVRFDLFTKPTDFKVWGQCLAASSIASLAHFLFRYYAFQKR